MTINEVLEKVSRVRMDAVDDSTKAGWLLELDGKLFREVIETHEMNAGEEMPDYPKQFPEDEDKDLLVKAPYDNLYELYVLAQVDFVNREYDNYNNGAMVYAAALDEWKKAYHRTHLPKGRCLKNVF